MFCISRPKMGSSSPVVLFLSLVTLPVFCDSAKLRIGIVGGGIGGTSVCHFLQELLQDQITIDVYEPYVIGGRLATTQVGDLHYETGGSIIHEDNQYVQEFMKQFNLTKKVNKKTNVPSKFGLYDGTEFLFKESSYQWLTAVKLLYRYGPLNFYNFQKTVEKMLQDFSHIYTLQKKKKSFLTVESLLRAMSDRFVPQLSECAEDGMKNVTSQLLLTELVSAGNLVNYGQSIYNMPEFVTYVSCAGMSGQLFSISGGNKQLAQRLLNACSGNLLRQKVTKIVHQEQTGTYVVHSASNKAVRNREGPNFSQKEENYDDSVYADSSENYTSSGYESADEIADSADLVEKEYDYVVIATPLSLSDIQFENMDTSRVSQHKRVKYHTTVTTLVQGQVNASLTPDGINEILLIRPGFLNSLSLLSSTSGDNSANVYKVFSQGALEPRQLNQLFEEGKYEVRYVKQWKAYPQYTCRREKEKSEKLLNWNHIKDKGTERKLGSDTKSESINEKYNNKDIETIKEKECNKKRLAKNRESKVTAEKTVDSMKAKGSNNNVDESNDEKREENKDVIANAETNEYPTETIDEVNNNLKKTNENIGNAQERSGLGQNENKKCAVNNENIKDCTIKKICDEFDVEKNSDSSSRNSECDGLWTKDTKERESCRKRDKVGRADDNVSSDETDEINTQINENDENISGQKDNLHVGKQGGKKCNRSGRKNIFCDESTVGFSEGNFVLNRRLYYLNVIELAASAMEMSAIGAKNVAMLLYNDVMSE